ncbi:Uncharacterized protein APZ42_018294 [Daphnia magna]|uniref:Uncharacterized protein n=1 Tax=Daphnia magna TaxID=35525 RepID=A0A164Z7H5_9CRUS|nr:Uncharacterized protein APZ42_018294 [Daphnia magna]
MENRTVGKFHPKIENSRHRRVPKFTNQSQPDLYDRNLNYDQTKKSLKLTKKPTDSETSLGPIVLDGE